MGLKVKAIERNVSFVKDGLGQYDRIPKNVDHNKIFLSNPSFF